ELFFFSSRRRHTRLQGDWSSDVCSSDLDLRRRDGDLHRFRPGRSYWPLSYGMVMPPMIGGIFYEHGHRMVAAAVGLLTVIQAIRSEERRVGKECRYRWAAVSASIE